MQETILEISSENGQKIFLNNYITIIITTHVQELYNTYVQKTVKKIFKNEWVPIFSFESENIKQDLRNSKIKNITPETI